MKKIGLLLILIVFFSHTCYSQEPTGLPFNLKYFMTMEQVRDFLHPLGMWETAKNKPNHIYYVIPVPTTKMKNIIDLKFYKNKLVNIYSGKYYMPKDARDLYIIEFKKIIKHWIDIGVKSVYIDEPNGLYYYKDSRSYFLLSTGPNFKEQPDYVVSIEIIESEYYKKNNPIELQ